MNKPKILIVDDRIENLVSLETLLSDINADIIRANSGNEALQYSLEHEFALVLIDVQMPDMDGFETVKLMRHVEKTKYVPVIFVSAIYSDDFYKIKGVESGAVDFITKPIIPEILLGKVTIFLELYAQKKKLENTVTDLKKALDEVETLKGLIPICASCKKVRDDKGFWTDVEHYIAARSDVDFSHSICPSCLEKEHPKIYAKLKAKGKI
ncbi:MAG: response regulator [Candidatus Cloacimonetes bacterium]|nr:response regulator [Candidatus Cloacimonadota bacterium]MBT5420237.1 response regulator [Candidatus Cloacimonadota bacterium]